MKKEETYCDICGDFIDLGKVRITCMTIPGKTGLGFTLDLSQAINAEVPACGVGYDKPDVCPKCMFKLASGIELCDQSTSTVYPTITRLAKMQ